MRKIILPLLGLLLLAGQGLSVRAQGAASARLFQVNSQGFPTIEALLDVYDVQGQFLTDLEPEDVTILEDGVALPVEELRESTPPAQIVVAVNPGPSLAVRNAQGISRFQYVVDALSAWAESQPGETPDDLSLVTIAGPLITHATPADWLVSLTSFQPNFRSSTPNLQSLVIALDTVATQPSQPGTKRAILFITPTMDGELIKGELELLAQRAREMEVRIFVWLVDAEMFFEQSGATNFRALAQQTGGEYFAFSGLQEFPDPEQYFSSLRHLYTLSYRSAINTAGEHTVRAQIQVQGDKIESEAQTFDLDIQPPSPILIAPPAQIVRQTPPEDPFNAEILLPEQQPIEIIIEFPDGFIRSLVRTTLYVDGQPVAENLSEPFDRFTWDLSGYTQSNRHELFVEAVDSLGLSKSSVSASVIVTVIQPPTGLQAFMAKYRTNITIGVLVVIGFLLVVILLYGRVRIRTLRQRREERKRYSDPVTQPVPIRQAEPPAARKKAAKRKQARGLRWMRSARLADAPAYLVKLRADGEPSTGNPIPLTEKEITFGNDPVQAMQVLDDPSISALHARIRRTDGGDFLLLDNHSVAGTWVNYEIITQEGYPLKHTDVVHFGQLMYRFTLSKPPAIPEPTIEFEHTDE